MISGFNGRMKEKKRGVGLKFMGLCFSAPEDHPVTLQQQPHFHYEKFQQYQQFQQNLHNQFPNHLHVRRPHPQIQIPQQHGAQGSLFVFETQMFFSIRCHWPWID